MKFGIFAILAAGISTAVATEYDMAAEIKRDEPSSTISELPTSTPKECVTPRGGQCAGITWKGCINCQKPYRCKYKNEYLSRCL